METVRSLRSLAPAACCLLQQLHRPHLAALLGGATQSRSGGSFLQSLAEGLLRPCSGWEHRRYKIKAQGLKCITKCKSSVFQSVSSQLLPPWLRCENTGRGAGRARALLPQVSFHRGHVLSSAPASGALATLALLASQALHHPVQHHTGRAAAAPLDGQSILAQTFQVTKLYTCPSTPRP